MKSSPTMTITFILIFVVMYSKSYDNLLEDPDVVIFINGNKAPNGTKDTIDGNTSTCLEIGGFYKEGPWFKDEVIDSWYVDFTSVRSVYDIIVSLASGYTETIELSIFVSNSSFEEAGYLCATDLEIMAKGYSKSFVVNMKCISHGRFVVLRTRLRRAYRSLLSICEVSITGCKDGKFGMNCNRNCSENCVGKSCDILEGNCLSGMYSDGWQGENLQQNEANNCALKKEEDNNTEVYALGVLLPVSILMNFVLLATCIRRFLITRKDETHDKQSPEHLNVRYGNNEDNKPPDGEQSDKSNVTYEVLGVPSSETHYDALQ